MGLQVALVPWGGSSISRFELLVLVAEPGQSRPANVFHDFYDRLELG